MSIPYECGALNDRALVRTKMSLVSSTRAEDMDSPCARDASDLNSNELAIKKTSIWNHLTRNLGLPRECLVSEKTSHSVFSSKRRM